MEKGSTHFTHSRSPGLPVLVALTISRSVLRALLLDSGAGEAEAFAVVDSDPACLRAAADRGY
jgi:hypothetical protein